MNINDEIKLLEYQISIEETETIDRVMRGNISGMNVALIGFFPLLSRKRVTEIARMVEQHGGIVQDMVDDKTDLGIIPTRRILRSMIIGAGVGAAIFAIAVPGVTGQFAKWLAKGGKNARSFYKAFKAAGGTIKNMRRLLGLQGVTKGAIYGIKQGAVTGLEIGIYKKLSLFMYVQYWRARKRGVPVIHQKALVKYLSQ